MLTCGDLTEAIERLARVLAEAGATLAEWLRSHSAQCSSENQPAERDRRRYANFIIYRVRLGFAVGTLHHCAAWMRFYTAATGE